MNRIQKAEHRYPLVFQDRLMPVFAKIIIALNIRNCEIIFYKPGDDGYMDIEKDRRKFRLSFFFL